MFYSEWHAKRKSVSATLSETEGPESTIDYITASTARGKHLALSNHPLFKIRTLDIFRSGCEKANKHSTRSEAWPVIRRSPDRNRDEPLGKNFYRRGGFGLSRHKEA
ncbi:hypothetical protein AGABI1DRAFT_83946 [Agaricus bisporus var. burnettii JB137-S8]|uniref:Uncharacterized protein n=1 Tax=Agaricus bisporus var. burnettii (strain JB137-S8 / ATCC MYA-4627 / FGSC 10392) TaxID=597362 RepID=K5XCY4_AGABU|nr:uncharacterized protein AGABI1DRAFT_83946 [Agaricus bisporus var. burnettii JB137-S8]EKM81012.1 hypothetical protein AGABI1DRAFT_83946 [Agaricus bisporus var. burnettii JB137-S8]